MMHNHHHHHHHHHHQQLKQQAPNENEINPLKKLNLQDYQKPKTLIVVHYKGRRISVPLLGECKNLTQMLYHHIDKFQQTIMQSSPSWQVLSGKKIVCFCSSMQQQNISNTTTVNASTVAVNNKSSTHINNHHHNSLNLTTSSALSMNPSTSAVDKQIIYFLKHSDGDLKIDLLLSLIRIQGEVGEYQTQQQQLSQQNSYSSSSSYQKINPNPSSLSLLSSHRLDITRFYKYMQIQPFLVEYPKTIKYDGQNNGMIMQARSKKFYLYRLLERTSIKNTYLARNLEDGHFYSLRVYRSELQMAENQARFLDAIYRQRLNERQQQQQQYLSSSSASHSRSHATVIDEPNNSHHPHPHSQSSIIPFAQIVMIPSPQQEQDQEEDQNQYYHRQHHPNFKHLAVIYPYHLKGKLSDRLYNKTNKLTETELLKYLKQLIFIAHTLHEEYNIIHRNLSLDSFEIDAMGNVRLTSFTSWVECYSAKTAEPIVHPVASHGHGQSGPPSPTTSSSTRAYYEQQFEGLQDGWYQIGHYTPPEVRNKSSQGYSKLVDFYTVGVVIQEIYDKVYQFEPEAHLINTKAKLVKTMINSLLSADLTEREKIVLQILEGMTKLQQTQRKNSHNESTITTDRNEISNLNLNEITLGQHISLESQQTCVENQGNDKDFNGISHQEIINYFRPIKPINAALVDTQNRQKKKHNKAKSSKQKKQGLYGTKVSRSQFQNVSNSRDKSVKSVKSAKSSAKSKDTSMTKTKTNNLQPYKQNGQKKLSKSKSKSSKKHQQKVSFNLSNPTKLSRTTTNDVLSPTNKKKPPQSKSKSRQKSINKNKSNEKDKKTTKTITQKSNENNIYGQGYQTYSSNINEINSNNNKRANPHHHTHCYAPNHPPLQQYRSPPRQQR